MDSTNSSRNGIWSVWAVWRPFFAILLVLGGMLLVVARPARADTIEACPSVLVIDANIGDYDLLSHDWLGDNPKKVAEDGTRTLTTAGDVPTWWSRGGGTGSAPRTFVLGNASTSKSLSADDIVWALDRIRASRAEPRSFVVAMGTTGLRLKEYAEDLANTRQSARADIVGMVFCGTPHMGYSARAVYPENTLWDVLARASGFSAADIVPEGAYIKKTNSGVFPAVSKTLLVSGMVGDLGFGTTDGAATFADLALAPTTSDQVMSVQATATIGRLLGLSHLWMPFASDIDYPGRAVDANLAERLSAMDSYETSQEVQAHVVGFYESWFAQGAPVTHNSSVLAIDLSGSMLDGIGSGTRKIDAAKQAVVAYLRAMQALDELPQSAPMDVTLLGFGETIEFVSHAYDDKACASVENMHAMEYSETNIGIALEEAMSTLRVAPVCAKKHVLLLSDGASTRGKSNAEMMATSVTEAKEAGIAIDVVGFGNVGESNAEFLKQVTAATGGTYYESNDEYEVERDFLKAYYGSLGLGVVDEELKAGADTTEPLGAADAQTSAWQVGVVFDKTAPTVTLMCNGEKVRPQDCTVHEYEGLLSIQCVNPAQGDYSLKLSNNKGRAHVFAAKQLGIARARNVNGEQVDLSFVLLVCAGALLAVGLVAVVVFTTRRARRTS